jgi:hypothetical protein
LLRPSGSARRCIPPEQVIGTAGGTSYGYDKNGRPVLTKEPKLLLNDDNAGKPEGIHLMTGPPGLRRVRQFDRRSADAGVHQGRRRHAARDAGTARRSKARVGFRIQIDGVDSYRGNVAGIPARSHRGNGAHIDDVYADRTVARPR